MPLPISYAMRSGWSLAPEYVADVLIVGAGPGGSSAAALLARRGWDVLLVDRAEFPRDKTCGDGLTPRAIPALDQLGLLKELSGRYQRISGARLVAPGGFTWQMRFSDHNLGLPPYGLVVPRLELDDRLLQHAVSRGATFRGGVQVTEPIYEGRQVVGVRARTGGETLSLRAPLTIIATGASIGLLRAFHVVERMPPGVNAIRGYFAGVRDLSDQFEFYFDRELSPGYAWIFPLADGRANVGLGIFSRSDTHHPPSTRGLLDGFVERHPRLRGAKPIGPPQGYPLRIDFPRYRGAGAGYLLVGEAAGLVNPVTGEGIDLALESAAIAAEAADAALRRGDTGPRTLAHYDHMLRTRYAGFFRGVHLLLRIATSPRALDLLIRKAPHRPYLAHALAGINMGVLSPWVAFSPRTWRDILT